MGSKRAYDPGSKSEPVNNQETQVIGFGSDTSSEENPGNPIINYTRKFDDLHGLYIVALKVLNK